MINEKRISDFMSNSPNTLQEFSDFINELIKEHGREKIITKANIDKNVLYRASNSQNITLENYYKIKQAYNNQIQLKDKVEGIKDLPIMGQIIENTHVRTLNPTQPINVPVPAPFIVDWSPVFGYLCVSGNAYGGFVYIFSGKGLTNTEQVNDTCVNRLIMIYPENSDPLYGMVLRNKKEYIFIHPRSREIIKRIPFDNNISWVKFVCLIPFSLMENYNEPKYQDNLVSIEDRFNKHLSHD